jgi:hypothetical protein
MMRRMTRWGGTVMATMTIALALSACGGEGGELREETERRRQEQGEMEKAGASGGDTAAATGEDGRLPAFVSDTPVATPDPAVAASDTPPPAKAQEPAGTGQWTASTSEVRRGGGAGVVRGLRFARNEGFDRMVIDFGQGATIPGWNIEYIDRAERCGSGDAVSVAGQGRLRVRLRTAQAHDDAGTPTVRQREMAFNSMGVLREMKMICDFEGDVEILLGVTQPKPYRVLELQNPSRLVIDVQQ